MAATSKILKKKLSESSKELEKDQKRIKEIEDLISKSSDYSFKTKETERTFKDGNRTHFVPGNKYEVTSSKFKRRFGGYNNKRALTPTRG